MFQFLLPSNVVAFQCPQYLVDSGVIETVKVVLLKSTVLATHLATVCQHLPMNAFGI